MKKRYSIKKLYIYFVLFISFSIIIFFSYAWISKQTNFLNYQITQFEARLINKENNLIKREVESVVHNIKYKNLTAQESLKKSLSSRVNIVSGIVDSLVKKYKNNISDDELKELIKTFLRDIRFNNNGYFFIADLNGTEILYPIRPEFENKNIINLQDSKGNYVIKNEINIIKKDGHGFVTDYWIKNKNDKKQYLKISYVKSLNVFNWYIGLGEYLDDFKTELKSDILNQLSNHRFGKSGYIYVNTYNGYSLLLDGKANKKPMYFFDKKDAKGNYTTRMQINIAKSKGSGYIHYYWNKIGNTIPIKKTAFVKGINEWEWIIGAGYYHDEIIEVTENARKDFLDKFRKDILNFIVFILIIILIIALFLYLLNKYISKEFDIFLSSFKESSLNNELIKDESIIFKELLFLTNSINEIIKEKKILELEIFNKRRLESLGVLAGGIAHDFNNLLTSILANINIAKEYTDINEIKKTLIEAEQATDRAKSLTQQLLTFSKGGEPILKILELPEFIKKTTAFLLSGSSIGIDYKIDENLWKINADKGQLGQVLENLLINAKQAILKDGKINIELNNEEINNKNVTEKFVKIKISDNGIGISKENINKIFDPYFTTKEEGNGLGLASVYSIIRKHKGVIYVNSEVNKGTVFSILLPAIERNIEKRENSNIDFTVNGKKILIMDDEEMILSISKKLFTHLGFKVTTVKNGTDLLFEYKKSMDNSDKFDILIMDLTIHGGMGGEEAIKELLKIDTAPNAIVSSGYSNSPIMANYQEYGFKGCLIKPYKLDDIKNLLNDICKKQDIK